MKTLSELSAAQRQALALIDKHGVVFRRSGGFSARGSATIEGRTMSVLLDEKLVRIRDERLPSGFTVTKVTLTDTGQVLVEQMRGKQAKRNAA